MSPEAPRRGGRGAIVAGVLLLLLAAGVFAIVHYEAGAGDDTAVAPMPTSAPPKSKPESARRPRVRSVAEPVVETKVDLEAEWKAALALKKAGKSIEALAKLAPLRRAFPEFFADPARAKVLAEMEKAAVDALAKLATNGSLDDVRKLAAELATTVFDPALAKRAADLAREAEKTVAALSKTAGGAVLERTERIGDKVQLAAHLFRFGGEGAAPLEKAAIDDQLAAVAAAAATAPPSQPLALPDAAETEKRRLAQLDELRQRDVVGLLDNLGGALAWLALHQGDDGHFGADVVAVRCAALGHAPCDKVTKESYPLAATGLAVLAFLDFRDQDRTRLFEPTLARAIRWILTQQEPDGAFKLSVDQRYCAPIALMALGQAAASSHDAELANAVQRGMNFYAGTAGADGGWRYKRSEPGDLSVTGWFAQAMESAVKAGISPPPEFRANLERFVNAARLSDTEYKYALADKTPRVSMSPVGMLVSAILDTSPDGALVKAKADTWRKSLATNQPQHLYMLYYAVRVSYLLDDALPDSMKKRLDTLAEGQTPKGPAAGMFALAKETHFKDGGASIATAFATLTLEHALYRR